MRPTTIAAAAAAILLAGCAKPGPAPKPQPGSWTMKNELVDLQGPGAEQMKPMMAAQMAMQNGKSICITPEYSEKSDPAKALTNGAQDCKFDRQEMTTAGVHIAGSCSKGGETAKLTLDGTITATSRDLTTTVEAPSPMGGGNMTMKLHTTSERTGDCKPTDITPPAGAGPM